MTGKIWWHLEIVDGPWTGGGTVASEEERQTTQFMCGEDQVMEKAVMTRFSSSDEDDIRPIIMAVNQLGVDLKHGKRLRIDWDLLNNGSTGIKICYPVLHTRTSNRWYNHIYTL